MGGDAHPFDEAVGTLRDALTFGIHPSLDGIRVLTGLLGRPQDAYSVVQVTGTNGKTSVTRTTAALLRAEGLRCAAYTSPHLESYTERMEIGGLPASEDEFADAVAAVRDAVRAGGRDVGAFTEFELLTAAALWLFRRRGVDVACLEVGMGGRWDSTSVADPAVAVVTGVGLDHTERLGGTVEAIAFDKAHIIRPAASVVLGPGTAETADIFLARAASFDLHPRFVAQGASPSPVADALTARYGIVRRPQGPGGEMELFVHGVEGTYEALVVTAPSYQAANVAVAVAAAECALGRALGVEAVRRALAKLTFPGRFEVIAGAPPVVLDGAHNPQAASVLAAAIDEAWPDRSESPVCVLGVLSDKDAEGIVRALAPSVRGFVVTQPDSPRARPLADLAALVRREAGAPLAEEAAPVEALALARTLAGRAGVVVTGSLYTVGQVRASMRA